MNVYKTILNQCYDFYLQLQDFNLLILDDLVLQVAQMYRQDVLALPQDVDYKNGEETCSIPPVYSVASWAHWCGGQAHYFQLLCLGNSG